MTTENNKIIQIDWRAVVNLLIKLIRFMRWPVAFLGLGLITTTFSIYWEGISIDLVLLLRYIDVLIWPMIALLFLWVIRRSIPSLVSRLEELSLPGGHAIFSKTQDQSIEDQGEELRELDPNASEPSTKTAADFQIANDDIHKRLTSYDAAAAYVQIYADIFGTQIDVLRTLADYGDGLKRDDLDDILRDHKRRTGGKGFNSIVPFMQFLLRNTLVRFNDEKYQLTIAGYYFLVFLHKADLLERQKDF